MDEKPFLSLPEAAARLGISRIAVFKKVKSGRLPGIRIGHNWAVPAGAVKAPEARAEAVTAPPRTAPQAARTPPSRGPQPAPPPPDSDPLDEMGWD